MPLCLLIHCYIGVFATPYWQTRDECDQFKGRYTLIEREDALEQGLKGCPDCGGDEYLVPNTTLAE